MNKPLKIAFFAALGLLVAGAPLVLPLSPYVLNMLMQTCTYAVAVLGMTVVLGYAGRAFDLRCEIREQLVDFLQREHPHALPRLRADFVASPANEQDGPPGTRAKASN